MSICYDLRFPELYRALAVAGARIFALPAAFTLATTRDHWQALLRARAIENEAFVVAANQVGAHPGHHRSGGRSMIVDPWGLVLAQAPDGPCHIVAELDLDRQRQIREQLPVLANRRPELYTKVDSGSPGEGSSQDPARRCRRSRCGPSARAGRRVRRRSSSMSASSSSVARARLTSDKRRQILEAAVRVFARQGFHACRVADIADEAGVAYGLVYHYFGSKDEILDTVFLERWNVMLETIHEVDRRELPPREKLHEVASFIVDSYSHDPDVMKVIIVEVTRAANSFGQTHLGQIRRAYELIGDIVIKAQAEGAFKPEIDSRFAAMAFYGAIEQMLTGWIFDLLPERPRALRASQVAGRRGGMRGPRAQVRARAG